MFMKEIPPMILTDSKYKGRVPQLTLARTTYQKIYISKNHLTITIHFTSHEKLG